MPTIKFEGGSVNWMGDEYIEKLRRKVDANFKKAGVLIQKAIRQNISTGQPPSSPGEFPHVLTGRLRQSVFYVVQSVNQTSRLRVGVGVIYGKYLELGTSKMAARPYLRKTIAKILNDLWPGSVMGLDGLDAGYSGATVGSMAAATAAKKAAAKKRKLTRFGKFAKAAGKRFGKLGKFIKRNEKPVNRKLAKFKKAGAKKINAAKKAFGRTSKGLSKTYKGLQKNVTKRFGGAKKALAKKYKAVKKWWGRKPKKRKR